MVNLPHSYDVWKSLIQDSIKVFKCIAIKLDMARNASKIWDLFLLIMPLVVAYLPWEYDWL